MTVRGRFITLEGLEGAGKSTQLEAARRFLEARGRRVVVTREPGGAPLAERLRTLLLDRDSHGLAVEAELLLLFAARAEHLHKTVRPALQAGAWVLCDRFTDATYAYQGGGRGVENARIALLETWVQGDWRPDLTLLFDLPVALGLERAGRRSAPDRFESETQAFFERVRQAYLARAWAEPHRIRLLDARQRPEQVSAAVCRQLAELMETRT